MVVKLGVVHPWKAVLETIVLLLKFVCASFTKSKKQLSPCMPGLHLPYFSVVTPIPALLSLFTSADELLTFNFLFTKLFLTLWIVKHRWW